MKKILIIITVFGGLAVAAYFLFLREPKFNTTGGYLVNLNETGVIIEGYDVVSYFTGEKPVVGSPAISRQYEGATYWFANAANAESFEKDPKKYAPQYGAFCGYAVSIGKLRPVDPTIYQVKDGRLILQHTQDAYRLFNKHLEENTQKADKNWPRIVSDHQGRPVEYDKPASPTTSSE